MIVRAEDRKQILTPNARGGTGTLDKREYVLERMPERAKMFAEIRLEPGCTLGVHPHVGAYEIFFYKESCKQKSIAEVKKVPQNLHS